MGLWSLVLGHDPISCRSPDGPREGSPYFRVSYFRIPVYVPSVPDNVNIVFGPNTPWQVCVLSKLIKRAPVLSVLVFV